LRIASNFLFFVIPFTNSGQEEEDRMKKGCMVPPECCVIIEMEKGASLGYRKAVLLNEIQALGSLKKAATVTRIDLGHARELVAEINGCFSQPLVDFKGSSRNTDSVALTEKGEKTVRSYWRQFESIWLDIMQERSRHY
jgi:molybdate transport repressor ModE-like protein